MPPLSQCGTANTQQENWARGPWRNVGRVIVTRRPRTWHTLPQTSKRPAFLPGRGLDEMGSTCC